MSAPTAPPLPALDNTWGALYIGVVIATALWGAACVQTYYYYDEYWKDDWRLKALVAVVWVFDTVHVICELMLPYSALITHYGNPTFIVTTTTVSRRGEVFILSSGFVILLVQAFYVQRIWKLSGKNPFLLSLLVALMCAEFASNTAFYAKVQSMLSVEEWLTITWLAKMVDAFDAATSTLITILVIFFLQRSRTGFRRTESMINRLVIWTINTGLLTSICAIVALIFVSVEPNNFIYVMFYGLISKLYTNSFLATLNVRRKERDFSNENSQATASSVSFSHILDRRNHSRSNKPITINIQSESRTMNDVESAQTDKDYH